MTIGIDMDEPREIQIHPSLNRPRLILGGERELVIYVGVISAVLIFGLVSWWSTILGILFWIFAMAVLVRMGKADALMRRVYLRHVRYQPYYPARSGLNPVGVRLPHRWR